MTTISLYFHIPFCRRRCGYCDFNTFSGMESFKDEYVTCLCREIEDSARRAPDTQSVHTIFFGGGTPSLLSLGHYAKILQVVYKFFQIHEGVEITIEANPETVSEQYLAGLHQLGINRVSFGMQSASEKDLSVLDRDHSNKAVENAVKWSRKAGFDNINLDLIYGIPGQTISSWRKTLKKALMYQVDHISAYILTIEEGTRLKKDLDAGKLKELSDDVVAGMYETCMDTLTMAGYQQYEISNWSTCADSRCNHNLQYWRYLPYLGFGAGAHSFWDDVRAENIGAIPEYIQRIKSTKAPLFPASRACLQRTTLSIWEKVQENMMVGLRLTEEGISLDEFYRRYGVNVNQVFADQIRRLEKYGLIEKGQDGDTLRLKRKGRLLGNQVFADFIGNPEPTGINLQQHQ